MFIKREALADTFALITFSIVVGMVIELFVAGLSFEQSLQSRLFSIPVNFIIARPYGLYRDWILGFSHLFKSKSIGNTVMDIFAYLSFQMPVYSILVWTTGASLEQVLTACLGQIGAFVLMARPFGMYLQFCRNWFVPVQLRSA